MHSFAILEAGSDALNAARSLQALRTDNGHAEQIPLSSAELQVDLCTVHITIWRGDALGGPHTHAHAPLPESLCAGLTGSASLRVCE